ncbi:PH domain-containing protein [Leekyejoonella antrihumi]|nr:PH domain-containing protein [Leekyejoonella antrihumi]
MRRYLLDDEHLVAAVHQHWARLAEVIVCCVVGFVLVVIIGLVTPASAGTLSNAAWWIWFVLLVYAAGSFWQWRREWFVATDRRLLLTYGVINHKVAMMPMQKVTDMSFNRSLPGLILGYGSFVMESAGQEQAMRRIDYIPHPDETYRSICDQIFGDRSDDAYADHLVPVDLATEAEHADPTDLPLRRYGDYLGVHPTGAGTPPEPRRTTRLRHRLLRRPRPAGDLPLDHYESDQGWTVSNEDASTPQPVSHRYRSRRDDEA